MLVATLEAEVEDYIARYSHARGDDGRRLVVRNGHAQARKITTGAGTMEIRAPRINDKRVLGGQRQKFTSWILPPYMRKSPKLAEALPVLYLRGLSTNDFRPALESLLGKQATMGLSATAISRLTTLPRRQSARGGIAGRVVSTGQRRGVARTSLLWPLTATGMTERPICRGRPRRTRSA